MLLLCFGLKPDAFHVKEDEIKVALISELGGESVSSCRSDLTKEFKAGSDGTDAGKRHVMFDENVESHPQ